MIAEDHAAGVLAEVAWGAEDGVVECEEWLEAGVGGGDAGFFDGFGEF